MAAIEEDVIPPHKKAVNKQLLITHTGRMDLAQYKRLCSDNGLPIEKVAYIFPGNNSHHNKPVYAVKGGANLADAAEKIGNVGGPCHSFPTRDVATDKVSPIAKDGVAGAYRLIGAGYSLILPTRKHSGADRSDNFDQELSFGDDLQPRFWGGKVKVVNKQLGQYYRQQLDVINHIIGLQENARKAFIADLVAKKERGEVLTCNINRENINIDVACLDAYLEGQAALTAEETPAWFKQPNKGGKLASHADGDTNLNNMLAPGKVDGIKTVTTEQGFQFRDDSRGGKKCYTFSKMGGKDGRQKLEFSVRARSVDVKTTKNMTYKDKQELAEAMFATFIEGHKGQPQPIVYTYKAEGDNDLDRAMRAVAQRKEKEGKLISKADHDAKMTKIESHTDEEEHNLDPPTF